MASWVFVLVAPETTAEIVSFARYVASQVRP
jgi:hypothetical protein